MKTLIFLFLIIALTTSLLSQSTPQPTPTAGINTTYFEPRSNSYIFTYSGVDGTLNYKYSLDDGGSLYGLTATVNNIFTYWPSLYGGVALDVAGKTYYAWDHAYNLIDAQLIENKLYVEWLAIPPYPLVVVEYRFRYIIYIEGRTLIIKAEKIGTGENIASQFRLERSHSEPVIDNSIRHYIIGIPYLNLFNVLYTGSKDPTDNRNVFTSFFFDWDSTNAAELLPWNEQYQNTSVYYAQRSLYSNKLNLPMNPLKEVMYLTVSPKLEEVFPNIPNPVVNSTRNESKNRIVFDCWQERDSIWNGLLQWEIQDLYTHNIRNCWMILHYWQKNGYDCGLPTDVMPAREIYGGDLGLIDVRNTAINYDYLFSLHEDYWFIQDNVPGYELSVLAQPEVDLPWCDNGHKQKPIKNTKFEEFYNLMVPSIKNTYGTNAIYVDAFTNALPHLYVDYDPIVKGSGKFSFALKKLRQAGTDIRRLYNNSVTNFSPISAEGGSHFLYVGYYDDFEAEIYTGKQNSIGYLFGGYFRPLLVDFDLLKMREKSYVHGVGLYDRFFCTGQYLTDCWKSDKKYGMGHDSALKYTATELAYAHGGYLNLL